MKMLTSGIKTLDTRIAKPPPKTANAFYQTKEWIEARDEAKLRALYRCSECGRYGCRLFVDHIVELQDGGAPYAQSNLQALCGSCHTLKTAQARAQRHRAAPLQTPGDGA